jgi:hypothetical protein
MERNIDRASSDPIGYVFQVYGLRESKSGRAVHVPNYCCSSSAIIWIASSVILSLLWKFRLVTMCFLFCAGAPRLYHTSEASPVAKVMERPPRVNGSGLDGIFVHSTII